MQKWKIFFTNDGGHLTHTGSIREYNGVFYCYDEIDTDIIVLQIPVRQVKYMELVRRNDT